MASTACRRALAPAPAGATHPGAVLQRYLQAHDKGEARRKLLTEAAGSAARIGPVYASAFARYSETITGVRRVFGVVGRMVTGLGTPSPLETGLRLHHTYGTPIIPGSCLKGLAAYYCRRVWGELDERFRPGDASGYYQVLFGTTEDAGRLIFHDAWILPETLASSLVEDVITVHHQEYYAGEAPPTDFDEPIPVPFLSVQGKFLVGVSSNASEDNAGQWAELAMALLAEALEEWGIGGKTTSGYGRLTLKQAVTSSERTQASAPGMPLKPGDIVKVRRVEDPKGKNRPWFQTHQAHLAVHRRAEYDHRRAQPLAQEVQHTAQLGHIARPDAGRQ
ncbi:MAG: type III-B CRISPR module RAMP protein Cmr6, partial [Bacillota bacterium]